MSQSPGKPNSRNSSIQLTLIQSKKLSDTSLKRVKSRPTKTGSFYSLPKINSIRQNQGRELKESKANAIRTNLLLSIDGERNKAKLSEFKINSKTAEEILASFDSFEVTIENPVEIGTPVLFINRSTPKNRMELEEKLDVTCFVKKIRTKKTISMRKFHNYTKLPLSLSERRRYLTKQKSSKYEALLQGCQYFCSLVKTMKKNTKSKSKFNSQENVWSTSSTLSDLPSSKSKSPKKKKKKRRRNVCINSHHSDDKTSSFKSDEDKDNELEMDTSSSFKSNSFYSNAISLDLMKKKSMTSLAFSKGFNCSSIKTVSAFNKSNKQKADRMAEGLKSNAVTSGNSNIIIFQEENEMIDLYSNSLNANEAGRMKNEGVQTYYKGQ